MYKIKCKSTIVIVCIFFFGICPINIFAQSTSTNGTYDWIKGKTTPEEYRLLERMSAVFIMDYSFLEKDLSPAKKEKLYKIIELLINFISEQETSSNISSRVFIVDVLSNYASVDIQTNTTLFTVYSSKYRNDTHLDVIVTYGYNEQTGKICNVVSTTQSFGTIQPFKYGNNFGVFRKGEYDIIQGACSGVFQILINGVYYNEVFSNALYYILPL